MPSWLADHPTLVDMLLVIAVMACGYLGWQKRRPVYAVGALAAVALLVTIWLVGRFLPSEAAKIEHALQEMSAGVKARDLERIFRHISTNFQQGSPTFVGALDKPAFRKRSESIIQSRNVEAVEIWDIEVEELSRADRRATVAFKAKPKGNWSTAAHYLVRAQFVLDPDGQWRLKGFEVFNPFVETRQAIQIPSS